MSSGRVTFIFPDLGFRLKSTMYFIRLLYKNRIKVILFLLDKLIGTKRNEYEVFLRLHFPAVIANLPASRFNYFICFVMAEVVRQRPCNSMEYLIFILILTTTTAQRNECLALALATSPTP